MALFPLKDLLDGTRSLFVKGKVELTGGVSHAQVIDYRFEDTGKPFDTNEPCILQALTIYTTHASRICTLYIHDIAEDAIAYRVVTGISRASSIKDLGSDPHLIEDSIFKMTRYEVESGAEGHFIWHLKNPILCPNGFSITAQDSAVTAVSGLVYFIDDGGA